MLYNDKHQEDNYKANRYVGKRRASGACLFSYHNLFF